MPSSKEAAILVVISFLIVALIYSSFFRSNKVFAYTCENFGDRTVKCCQTNPDGKSAWCTTCDKTDPPSNCSPRFLEGAPNTPTPPPTKVLPVSPPASSNALPPPSTQTCADGSTPDANGNCPATTTTNQQVAPSQSLGGSTSNNNNNPTPEHNHKGSNQPTQIAGGETTVTKKHKVPKTDQGTTQSSS